MYLFWVGNVLVLTFSAPKSSYLMNLYRKHHLWPLIGWDFMLLRLCIVLWGWDFFRVGSFWDWPRPGLPKFWRWQFYSLVLAWRQSWRSVSTIISCWRMKMWRAQGRFLAYWKMKIIMFHICWKWSFYF